MPRLSQGWRTAVQRARSLAGTQSFLAGPGPRAGAGRSEEVVIPQAGPNSHGQTTSLPRLLYLIKNHLLRLPEPTHPTPDSPMGNQAIRGQLE